MRQSVVSKDVSSAAKIPGKYLHLSEHLSDHVTKGWYSGINSRSSLWIADLAKTIKHCCLGVSEQSDDS